MIPEASPRFTSLARTRVPFAIVSQITDSIARGEMPPGSRLPAEPELTAQFGVGRNALREAIKILETFGLVVIRRGDGTYIQDACTFDLLSALFLSLIWEHPSPEEYMDFFLAARHAQLSFLRRPPEPGAMGAYAQAHQALCRLSLEGGKGFPVEPPRVEKALLDFVSAKNGLAGETILGRLVSYVRGIYAVGSPEAGEKPPYPNWPLFREMLDQELRAVQTGDAGEILRFLEKQRAVWEDPFSVAFWAGSGAPAIYEPSPRQPASRNIFWQIMTDIISGRYPTGSRLPTESEMIESFQVSCNVIREAIKSLEAVGVLEIRRPEGTFVAEENTAQSAFVNWGAYGRILSNENALRFLEFKAMLRDAVFLLACRQADRAGRARFRTLSNAFAQNMLSINPSPALCLESLSQVNACISELCGNPILRRVEDITLQISADSRSLFIDNALKEGRQREVAQAYLRDAEIMAEGRLEEIGESMRTKFRLWVSLEIASLDRDALSKL